MSNVVQFILQLKDMMSGGMLKAASTAQRAMNSTEQAVKKTKRETDSLGTAFTGVKDTITDVNRTGFGNKLRSDIERTTTDAKKLKHELNNINAGTSGRGVSSGSSGGGMGMLGTLIKGGIYGYIASQAIGTAAQAGGFILKNTAQKEQDITGLTTFLGAKGAQNTYAQIQKDAAVTPFDTASLLQVNRALISAGVNAKNARTDALNLANAISAVGGGNDELARMAANMQQIKTVGKATAMDIRQFAMAGINIYQMLANSTGKNIEQVKEMDVTYEQLSAALSAAAAKGGMYYGALEAQGKTMAGRWNTVIDSIQIGATQIGDAFAPIINKVLDWAMQLAQNIPQYLAALKPYIDAINNAFVKVFDWVTNIGKTTGGWGDYLKVHMGYINALWEALKSIFSAVWRIGAKLFEWIGHSQLLKDVFGGISDILANVWKVVKWVADKLEWVYDHTIGPILNAIENMYRLVRGLPSLAEEAQQEVQKKKAEKEANEQLQRLRDNFNKNVMPGIEAAYNAAQRKRGMGIIYGGASGGTGRLGSSGITQSGAKTVTINIKDIFGGDLKISSVNIKEGVGEMEAMIEEGVRRVLYTAAAAAG